MNRVLRIENLFLELDKSSASSLQSLNSEKISTSLGFIKKIFLEFFEVGVSSLSDSTSKNELIKSANIIKHITKHNEWMQHYIPVYSRDAIDFLSERSDERVYEVRSGIEFMFTLLKNVNGKFDVVLNDIRTYGSIEDEFDVNLKLWINNGAHVPLEPTDVPKNLPSGHWWWKEASTK